MGRETGTGYDPHIRTFLFRSLLLFPQIRLGMTPRNYFLIEWLLSPLLTIAGAIFQIHMDSLANNPRNRQSDKKSR
jgi:hypothetical protein